MFFNPIASKILQQLSLAVAGYEMQILLKSQFKVNYLAITLLQKF